MAKAMPLIAAERRSTFLEALADLERFNLLQPPQPGQMQAGVAARNRQWAKMRGGVGETGANLMFLAAGAGGGALFGVFVAVAIPPVFLISPFVIGGLIGAAIGGFLGYALKGMNKYEQGMLRAIVNERLSPIRPEMVTGQVEAWIPKALLSWRSHEWRYIGGKPYLWFHLPVGTRIQGTLKGTLDYLMLPNDLYRARDAAVYAQRNWNRRISNAALDYADVDADEEGGDNKLLTLAPWILAGLILLVATLIVVMKSS